MTTMADDPRLVRHQILHLTKCNLKLINHLNKMEYYITKN